MPEVHVPNLGDEEHEDQLDPAATPGAPSMPHRRHSLLKLLLEVVLITTGVYLGLAGESSCPSHRSHGRGPWSLHG